jgi:hypothetical protein
MENLIHPLHYLIVRREGVTWYFKPGNHVFYNPRNVPVSLNLDDRLHRFGLTVSTVIIEMFRLNCGKPGYYLANLREKKFYYCGLDFDDVKAVFLSLGIGRQDPMENGR